MDKRINQRGNCLAMDREALEGFCCCYFDIFAKENNQTKEYSVTCTFKEDTQWSVGLTSEKVSPRRCPELPLTERLEMFAKRVGKGAGTREGHLSTSF